MEVFDKPSVSKLSQENSELAKKIKLLEIYNDNLEKFFSKTPE